jgi:predicted TIM-barrel enzyme
VGSGVHEGNVVKLLSVADGVIVGTSFKQDGITTNPVDEKRVARLMAVVRESR